MSCGVTEQQLWSWIDRAAPELERHVKECAHCAALAQQLRSGIAHVAQSAPAVAPRLPERLGPYTILGVLGHGGQGVVFEAEQPNPRRRVALKVLRGGHVLGPHDVRLFQREVQSLARLRHPAIAAIYDAGQTDDGQHYFAMELVRGPTVTAYAQNQSLSSRDRLDLFRRVCEAIHYAHQRGVIHRDLKPSNILVVEEAAEGSRGQGAEGRSEHPPPPQPHDPSAPQPKVLDFGLARLSDVDVTLVTGSSFTGQVMGTLPYMSPEQARGAVHDLDVRTDVYSLGVVLYELLTGALPYRISGAPLPEAVRVICEQPPQRPSSVHTLLRGDVETIVLKALEKEPARRYQSADALAGDIQRYLTDQPILARPPSVRYQLGKLVARHKLPFALTGALFVALAGFGVGMSILYARAVEAERQVRTERDETAIARQAADEAARVARAKADNAAATIQFLQSILASADPLGQLGRDATISAVLHDAADRIDRELADMPEVQSAVQDTIGRTYQGLGELEEAQRHLGAALATRRRVLGDTHADTLLTMQELGEVLFLRGRLAEAEGLLNEAWTGLRATQPADSATLAEVQGRLGAVLHGTGRFAEAETLLRAALLDPTPASRVARQNNLASLLHDTGRFQEAAELYRECLELAPATTADHGATRSHLQHALAISLTFTGSYDDAERAALESVAARRRIFGEGHPLTAESLAGLAEVKRHRGQSAEAEQFYREALAALRERVGTQTPTTADALSGLGTVLLESGRYEECEARYREALSMRRSLLPPRHPHVAESLHNLGAVLLLAGRPGEAEPLMRESLGIYQATFGDEDLNVANTLNSLGRIVQALGRLDEAERLYGEFVRLEEKLRGSRSAEYAHGLNNLANVLRAAGRYDEAIEKFSAALDVVRALFGPDHPLVAGLYNNLGTACYGKGDLAAARGYFERALKMRRRLLPEGHPDAARTMFNLACTLHGQGQNATAEPLMREALERRRAALRPGHPDIEESTTALGKLLRETGRAGEAEPLLRESIEILNVDGGGAVPRFLAEARAQLGACLVALQRHAEAEPLLLAARDALKQPLNAEEKTTRLVLEQLAAVYDALDRTEEAAALRSALPPPQSQAAQSAPAP